MRPVILSDLKGVDRKTLNALKKDGIESLEDLKMIDTAQFSTRTGVSKTFLDDLMLRAELQAYEALPDIADALVASRAINRIGELAAIESEEILAFLAEGDKSIGEKDVSIEAIEALRAQVPLLSFDEETTRGVQIEDSSAALFDEEGPALRAEEPVVSRGDIKALHAGLERSFRIFSDNLQAIEAAPEGTIEIIDLQAQFSSLQADLQAVLVEAVEKLEPELGVVQGEDEAPVLADEETDPEEEIKALSTKLTAIQGQITELQIRHISADEELSPTASAEGEPTELRGE